MRQGRRRLETEALHRGAQRARRVGHDVLGANDVQPVRKALLEQEGVILIQRPAQHVVRSERGTGRFLVSA